MNVLHTVDHCFDVVVGSGAGAMQGYRSLDPMPFDGAGLGGEFARLRPPSPGTLIGGRMSVTSNGHELSRRGRNHRTGNDVRLHRRQSRGEALYPVRRERREPPGRRIPGRRAMTDSMGPEQVRWDRRH